MHEARNFFLSTRGIQNRVLDVGLNFTSKDKLWTNKPFQRLSTFHAWEDKYSFGDLHPGERARERERNRQTEYFNT